MNRAWLEKFYTECGREVSLAYNVLNYSNNWGVTLGGAVLATGFMSAVKVDTNGTVQMSYPTVIHWYFVIFSWIIMCRFFVRSALGLVNMYRWNNLISASSKVLSLEDNNPSRGVFERNFEKLIGAYYYSWKSPLTKRKLIWRNLKLMYLWFLLIVFALFFWGLVALKYDIYYLIGLALFLIPTALEIYWFSHYDGLEYKKVDLENEPNITHLWQSSPQTLSQDSTRPVVFGFCREGPYKHALAVVTNLQVKWLPWSYHVVNIDPTLANDLALGATLAGRKVFFAAWDTSFRGQTTIIRCGRIDHFVYSGGILRATVNFGDCVPEDANRQVEIKDPKVLCLYS
jgi:hypothetical protein